MKNHNAVGISPYRRIWGALATMAMMVGGAQAQSPEITIPISVYGQNVFGAETLNIIFDPSAKAPSTANPNGADDFDDFYIGSFFGSGDEVRFLSGSAELLDDARPTLGDGENQQFRLNVTLGIPAFKAVPFGVYYLDEDNDLGYSPGEYMWIDENGNGSFDDGETRLNDDVNWSVVPGDVGQMATVYFSDTNPTNDAYDTGEAVWVDSNFLSGDITYSDPTPNPDPDPDTIHNEILLGTPVAGEIGASVHSVNLVWNEDDIPSNTDAKIITSTGAVLVADMADSDGDDATNVDRVLVISQSMDVFFVFGPGNLPANVSGIESRVITGSTTPITIDPFADPTTIVDIDANVGVDAAISIVSASDGVGGSPVSAGGTFSTTKNGSVKFADDGLSFAYTAPTDDFSSDPFDRDTWDSFTYIVSDGDSVTPLQSTGLVQILVLADEVVAVRTHADRAKAGLDLVAEPDAGLEVTVTMTLDEGVGSSLATLTFEDVFPALGGGSDPTGSWELAVDPAGAGLPLDDPDHYQIGGTNPPNKITVLGDQVTFGWEDDAGETPADTTLSDLAGLTSISFTYRIVGPATDLGPRSITNGLVVYNVGGDDEEFSLVDTNFEAVDKLFHTADFRAGLFDSTANWPNADGTIDAGEVSRAIEYFKQGGYELVGFDLTTPDGYSVNSTPPAPTVPHSADFRSGLFDSPSNWPNPDGRLDAGEISRLIQYFQKGGYEATDFSITTPDGYKVQGTR